MPLVENYNKSDKKKENMSDRKTVLLSDEKLVEKLMPFTTLVFLSINYLHSIHIL